MKRAITMVLLGVCILAVWFAVHLDPTDPEKPPTPTPATICERWQDTLAARIGKSIKMTDELTLVLVELHNAGDITDAELKAVQDAMPDMLLKNRALTEADAEKIRGVK